MGDLKPFELILRCYGRQTKEGNWFGICLDLNLAAEAESPDLLRQKMNAIILSYLETVLDTDDNDSIPQLLYRRAPIRNWLIYYLIKCIDFIRQFPGNFTFQISPYRTVTFSKPIG